MISQDLIKESPHRRKIMQKDCVLSWLEALGNVIASRGCRWLRLKSEAYAAKIGYVVTPGHRNRRPALVADKDDVNRLQFGIPLGLLSWLPARARPRFSWLWHHDHVRLAGRILDVQYAVLSELAVRQLCGDLRADRPSRVRLRNGHHYRDSHSGDGCSRPDHRPD
ncbi:MAG: hypothetical protein ACRDP5_26895 [Streptosporangiaceae bacterium]